MKIFKILISAMVLLAIMTIKSYGFVYVPIHVAPHRASESEQKVEKNYTNVEKKNNDEKSYVLGFLMCLGFVITTFVGFILIDFIAERWLS